MGESLQPIDSFKSFQHVSAKIDEGVKTGKLSREKAHEIIGKARVSYSSQAYNREIEKHKRK
jgi:hypothetical protein